MFGYRIYIDFATARASSKDYHQHYLGRRAPDNISDLILATITVPLSGMAGIAAHTRHCLHYIMWSLITLLLIRIGISIDIYILTCVGVQHVVSEQVCVEQQAHPVCWQSVILFLPVALATACLLPISIPVWEHCCLGTNLCDCYHRIRDERAVLLFGGEHIEVQERKGSAGGAADCHGHHWGGRNGRIL